MFNLGKLKDVVAKYRSGFALLALTLLWTGSAVAGTGGIAGFDDFYVTIVESAQGTIGKIVTACAVIWGFINVIRQNWIQVIGAFLAALLLSQLDTIVTGIFTATLVA